MTFRVLVYKSEEVIREIFELKTILAHTFTDKEEMEATRNRITRAREYLNQIIHVINSGLHEYVKNDSRHVTCLHCNTEDIQKDLNVIEVGGSKIINCPVCGGFNEIKRIKEDLYLIKHPIKGGEL